MINVAPTLTLYDWRVKWFYNSTAEVILWSKTVSSTNNLTFLPLKPFTNVPI
ncbi:hypothetical protein LX87_01288 [Larkinella arboricola]|uniref:Uncharacterized protein n=1 Tax=Larkinella arboricola TaxID=643671 RepID=A0A327XG68_LARAB|nr:hypothetical protein LX87_01288 [Larkinella arboricola]